MKEQDAAGGGTRGGPGWPVERVAALLMIGIAAGAALGVAVAAAALLLVAGAPGMIGRLGWWVLMIGGAASGIAAGGGLYLFEKRMRERHAPRSGTVEGDFGGRAQPGR